MYRSYNWYCTTVIWPHQHTFLNHVGSIVLYFVCDMDRVPVCSLNAQPWRILVGPNVHVLPIHMCVHVNVCWHCLQLTLSVSSGPTMHQHTLVPMCAHMHIHTYNCSVDSSTHIIPTRCVWTTHVQFIKLKSNTHPQSIISWHKQHI